jgi:hypothetical protein
MERGGHGDFVPVRDPLGHQDGLGRAGRAVIERGVGDVQPGELADERLVLEDDLERALADLGLVGRVRADELAPRAQVIDDRRDEVVVGPSAEEGQVAGVGVLAADPVDRPDELELRLGRRQVERPVQPDRFGDAAEQVGDRAGARPGQHLLLVFVAE